MRSLHEILAAELNEAHPIVEAEFDEYEITEFKTQESDDAYTN